MNFSTLVNDERQCNRHSHGEHFGDLPMRIVGAVTICFVDGVGIDLRAAVCFCEPAEELRVFARRFGRQDKFFAVGLLCFLCRAITEIPRQRIAVGGKLRVEGLGCRDGHSVVQAAARSGSVPALESVTGLDRRARRGGCHRIRLACRDDAGLVINGAAVCARVPCDGQADGRAAIVALAVAIRVDVVCVFFTGSLTNRAGFRAFVLGIAYA